MFVSWSSVCCFVRFVTINQIEMARVNQTNSLKRDRQEEENDNEEEEEENVLFVKAKDEEEENAKAARLLKAKAARRQRNKEKYLEDPEYFRQKNAKSRMKRQATVKSLSFLADAVVGNEALIAGLKNEVINHAINEIRLLRGLTAYEFVSPEPDPINVGVLVKASKPKTNKKKKVVFSD